MTGTRAAIYDEIAESMEAGRRLIENDRDRRNSGRAHYMLYQYEDLPKESRGTFPQFLSAEMTGVRERQARGESKDGDQQISEAAEWASKHYADSLRTHFESVDAAHEAAGGLSPDQLEAAKQHHQRLNIHG